MSSITTQAATAAILAAGLNTRLSRALQVSGVPLVPSGPPGPAEVGFSVSGSKAVDIKVSFHRDARARSVFLQIDRDNAPLTGNYVLEIDTSVSTYNATSGAPADVDALLVAWAAQIESDHSGFTATPAAFSGESGDDADGILVTGDTTTGAYVTYALGADCAAPEAAALHIWREVDDADLVVWTKSAMTLPSDYTLAWQGVQALGWVPADVQADLVDNGKCDRRFDFAGRLAVWPELKALEETDETITVLTGSSGAGVYGLTNLVVVAVAPQVQP